MSRDLTSVGSTIKKDDSIFDGYTNIMIPQTGTKVRYHEKDPIFDLSEPHVCVDPKVKKPLKPVDKCHCCRTEKPKKCS
jgi:hypothetical protein